MPIHFNKKKKIHSVSNIEKLEQALREKDQLIAANQKELIHLKNACNEKDSIILSKDKLLLQLRTSDDYLSLFEQLSKGAMLCYISLTNGVFNLFESYTHQTNLLFSSLNYFSPSEKPLATSYHNLLLNALKLVRIRDKIWGDYAPNIDNGNNEYYTIYLNEKGLLDYKVESCIKNPLFFKNRVQAQAFMSLIQPNEYLSFITFIAK